MGGLFQNGQWVTRESWEKDELASFKRQESSFRQKVSADPDAPFPAQAGRYHLYVSYACPWAHRTLIMRALLGLEDIISISVVHPFMDDDGWSFDSSDAKVIPDPIQNASHLRELYVLARPDYTGRVTVPVLWDKQTNTLVNNESRDIIRMMSRAFLPLASRKMHLAPDELIPQIDEAIDAIYEPINNGVYKCGFAGSQEAYNRAFVELFEQLDVWEEKLATQRFVCGEQLTEADICLFTTLLRFDPVYYVHFKCNKKLIKDYNNLSGFMRSIYQLDGVAQTCHLDHITQHYYRSHPQLNPKRIVPLGHDLGLDVPHGRERLS